MAFTQGIVQYAIITSITTILLLVLFGWQIRMWHPIMKKKLASKNTFCSRLHTYKEYSQKGNSLVKYYDNVLSSRFCFLCKLIGNRALESGACIDMEEAPGWGIQRLMRDIVENVSSKYVEDTTMPCNTQISKLKLMFWNSRLDFPKKINSKGDFTILFSLGTNDKKEPAKSVIVKEGSDCVQIKLKKGGALVVPSFWTTEVVNLPSIPHFFLVCSVSVAD